MVGGTADNVGGLVAPLHEVGMEHKSGRMPQGALRSEVAMQMGRGMARQWPQLAGQEETGPRPSWGCACPTLTLHHAPGVLSCSNQLVPHLHLLCAAHHGKRQVCLKGDPVLCEPSAGARGQTLSLPLHPREGLPAFCKALGSEVDFLYLSENCFMRTETWACLSVRRSSQEQERSKTASPVPSRFPNPAMQHIPTQSRTRDTQI